MVVDELDAPTAMHAGILAHGLHAASRRDAAAAHAVHVAQQRGWSVVSAYRPPLRGLDAGLEVELLPR